MALKIRGSSQILSNSIEFAQIQKISPARILGLSENSVDGEGNPLSAAPTELQATDIRKIANLWEDDSPTLNGLSLDKYEGAGGNLSVEGTGNIDGDMTVNTDKFKVTALSGNIETKGEIEAESHIKLITSDDDEKHVLSNDGTLTSKGKITSKDSLEINDGSGAVFSVTDTGALTASGIGDFGGDVTAGDDITLDESEGKVIAKLLSLDTGSVGETMVFDSTGLTIGKDLVVDGDFTVEGTTTIIDTNHLKVEDSLIYLAMNNGDDTLDIGFVGKSSAGYHGLVRDANDSGKFKLFNTSTDLSELDEVDFDGNATLGSLSVGHLDSATISGALTGSLSGNATTATTLASSRDFSLSGDVTAVAQSFDGGSNLTLTTVLADNVIDVDNFQAAAIVTETEGLDSSDNDTSLPTTAAVKDYVDSAVNSGGFDTVANMDLQMGHGTSFERVYEKTIYHTVENHGGNYDEAANQNILLNGAQADRNTPEIDSNLEDKIMVFVNGQKVRVGTALQVTNSEVEFFITDTNGDGSGHRSVLQFKSGSDTIAIGDEIEIKYYVKYS